MTGATSSRIAVVCDDRADLRGPVVRLLTACGYDVRAVVTSFAQVPDLVAEHAPCLAVVALPLTGMSGLGAVRELRQAVPACEVVLLSPSDTLQLAALEAGARALVPEDDLRALRLVLHELAGAPSGLHLPAARVHPEGVGTGSVSTNPSS